MHSFVNITIILYSEQLTQHEKNLKAGNSLSRQGRDLATSKKRFWTMHSLVFEATKTSNPEEDFVEKLVSFQVIFFVKVIASWL